MNSIIRVFPETHLGLGHKGLSLLVKKESNKDVARLSPGHFVMFLNKAQTAFKLYCANNTVVYYKHPRGRVNLEAVKYFPQCFTGAGELNYDKALEKVLTKRLKQ